MNNISKITVDTPLSDLLAAYPFLKEALPQIHAKFKMLNTPLGKVMMHQATISEMSKRSGMDVNVLIHAITESIGHHQ